MSRQFLFFFFALVVAACHNTASKEPVPSVLPETSVGDRPGLLLGEFSLPAEAVVDGDTIKVVGLSHSLRLLGIDTEETFKKEADRRDASADWTTYLQSRRGGSKRPVKMATPLGEDAKEFAKKFFEGVQKVRLERDHPLEIRDRYGRYLAYVFVERGNEWVSYNVEAVRFGMTPYFVKYGYSRRFHEAFVAAEAEARAAKRGVWDPNRRHYPDYDERRVWWQTRADFMAKFDHDLEHGEGFVVLSREDALAALQVRVGKTAEVMGALSEIKDTGKGPTLVLLGRKKGADFPLVFFNREVLEHTGLLSAKDELVRARGKVSLYHRKSTDEDELELVIDDAQAVTSTAPGN